MKKDINSERVKGRKMKDNTFNKIKEKISSLKEIEGGYYKELFKDISMKEFNSLEDFEKLPFTI